MFEDAEEVETSDQPIPAHPSSGGAGHRYGDDGEPIEETNQGNHRLAGSPAEVPDLVLSLERTEPSRQLNPLSTVVDCDPPGQCHLTQVDQGRLEFLGFLWIKLLDAVPLDLGASGVDRLVKKGGCLPLLGVARDPKDDSVLFGPPSVDKDLTVAELKSSAVVHRAELMFELPTTVERFQNNLEPVGRVANVLLGQSVSPVETLSAEERNESIRCHFDVHSRRRSDTEVNLVRLGRKSDPPLFLRQLDPFIGPKGPFRIRGCTQSEAKLPDPPTPLDGSWGGSHQARKPLVGCANKSPGRTRSDELPLEQ